MKHTHEDYILLDQLKGGQVLRVEQDDHLASGNSWFEFYTMVGDHLIEVHTEHESYREGFPPQSRRIEQIKIFYDEETALNEIDGLYYCGQFESDPQWLYLLTKLYETCTEETA